MDITESRLVPLMREGMMSQVPETAWSGTHFKKGIMVM